MKNKSPKITCIYIKIKLYTKHKYIIKKYIIMFFNVHKKYPKLFPRTEINKKLTKTSLLYNKQFTTCNNNVSKFKFKNIFSCKVCNRNVPKIYL
jgi:hypothetical protein